QPDYATAARRQGAIWRSAFRRNGGVGARSLRRRAHPARTADLQIGRRSRALEDLRSHRQRRIGLRAGLARIVQRADPRVTVALSGRGAAARTDTRGVVGL